MSDYRVRISIRNERLLSAIENAGYPSARQCSIANGYPEYLIGNLVNGSIKPLEAKTGKPTKFCKEVLKILGKNIEDCFTPRQLQGFKIVRLHYGIGSETTPQTFQEISLIFAVSHNRIKQICDKAIRKLQHPVTKGLLLSTGFYDKFTKVDVNPVEIDSAEQYLQ